MFPVVSRTPRTAANARNRAAGLRVARSPAGAMRHKSQRRCGGVLEVDVLAGARPASALPGSALRKAISSCGLFAGIWDGADRTKNDRMG
jgi:hypothetical protein